MFVNLRVLDGSISIHALLAESDHPKTSDHPHNTISIHALLAESDWSNRPVTMRTWKFLSTLSLRRATLEILLPCLAINNFYPRSPCGERPLVQIIISGYARISIHALLAESDETTPYRVVETHISIHALLAESDRLSTILYSCPGNFYPRSPCGERPSHLSKFNTSKSISIHALLAESDSMGLDGRFKL